MEYTGFTLSTPLFVHPWTELRQHFHMCSSFRIAVKLGNDVAWDKILRGYGVTGEASVDGQTPCHRHSLRHRKAVPEVTVAFYCYFHVSIAWPFPGVNKKILNSDGNQMSARTQPHRKHANSQLKKTNSTHYYGKTDPWKPDTRQASDRNDPGWTGTVER